MSVSLQVPGSPHIEQISSVLSRSEAFHFNILLHGSQKNMIQRLFRLTLSGMSLSVPIRVSLAARTSGVKLRLTLM